MRQQILMLWLDEPTLLAGVVAWAFHDGADGVGPVPIGDEPYAHGLDALRDGWRVIQISPQTAPVAGHEHQTSVLPNEFVFERMIDIAAIP